jgi:hypothetical protein
VDPEAKPVVLNLPPGSGLRAPRPELDTEHAVPETASAIGVVGGELDQRRRHGPEYAAIASTGMPVVG